MLGKGSQVLGAIYHTLSESQAGSEVNMSLQALLAGMIKHELALLLFGAVGSYFPGNPEPFGKDVFCYLPRWVLHLYLS